MTGHPSSLLVIYCPGADNEAVNHLIDQGSLPNLKRCVEHGSLAPLNWTPLANQTADTATVATGNLPFTHGAVAGLAPRQDGLGQAPLTRDHLQVVPLWELWSSQNISSCAIGWPATHHTKETQAHVIADTFFQIEGASQRKWPVFPGSVHPWQEIETLKTLRTHPADCETMLRDSPYGEHLNSLLEHDSRRAQIIFSRLNTITTIGRHYLAHQTQAVFVNLDLLEQIGLPKTETEAQIILGYYELLDTGIGHLTNAAKENTSIAIITRPPSAALEQGGEAVSGRGQAIFVSPQDEPDSLHEMIVPKDIAPKLCRILGAGELLEAKAVAKLSPAFVDADPQITAQLEQNHERQKPRLKTTARQHIAATLNFEAEFLRSFIKAKGAKAGSDWIQNRDKKLTEDTQLNLAAADRLIRDRKTTDAKYFLGVELHDTEQEARRQFLLANVALMEDRSGDAISYINRAHALAPNQPAIAAMWGAFQRSKDNT